MIDDTDLHILNELQSNARIANAEIARKLGMAPSAILERIRKLEERGILKGYGARIDAAALGRPLLAFVFLSIDESLRDAEVGAALSELPEVLEVHDVAGDDSYLVKVRVADTDDLYRFLREDLARVPRISSTRTVLVLKTWKETGALPLPMPPGRAT